MRFLLTLVLILLCALVIPACGGGDDDGIVIPPLTVTLLSDDFSSGNLNNWTVQSSSASISSLGNPQPSMLLVGAPSGPNAIVYSNASFLTNGALTIAADVQPGDGNATFDIVDAPNPPSVSTFASVVNNAVLYSINGNSTTVNYTNDGLYHRITLTLNSGIAIWARDGVVQHTAAWIPPATIQIELRDLGSGTTGSRFDNILVTMP